ncbi:MAG: hypothetical protein IPI50_14920 [Saprospiraceae bacterium]|nr:hypothetical protein [Saprospiraceae bacterium]
MEKRNRGGSLHIGFKPSTMLKHLFLILFLVLSTAKGYSQCPISGYSYIGNFDGHHYYLSNYGTNPSLAYGDAVAAGGYLASINSAAENDWLSNLVPDYITIGLSDLAVEGTFVWHSGEPLTYTDWWPGEPNNSGDEDYTVTNFGDIGKWNDVPDWVTPQFIVEFVDSDADGTMDICDNCPSDPNKTEEGICGCGVSDADSDGDGTVDCNDGCPTDPNKTEEGICGCGVSDADRTEAR